MPNIYAKLKKRSDFIDICNGRKYLENARELLSRRTYLGTRKKWDKNGDINCNNFSIACSRMRMRGNSICFIHVENGEK
jgi:hypothetical protein